MQLIARDISGNDRVGEDAQKLRHAIDMSYARIRENARIEWERQHRGIDPTDACVSIKIQERGPLSLPSKS
jgi:hypothetical protein